MLIGLRQLLITFDQKVNIVFIMVKNSDESHDVTAFRLANKASELFESSKINEKRELINFVFSNLALRGRKLEYTLRKPFDMLINLGNRLGWLPGTDSNRRPSD